MKMREPVARHASQVHGHRQPPHPKCQQAHRQQSSLATDLELSDPCITTSISLSLRRPSSGYVSPARPPRARTTGLLYRSYSAFGAVPAERRPANLITLCDGHGTNFVNVTRQILMAVRKRSKSRKGSGSAAPRSAALRTGDVGPADAIGWRTSRWRAEETIARIRRHWLERFHMQPS